MITMYQYQPTTDERLREAMALRMFEAVANHAEHSSDPDVLCRVAVAAVKAMKAGLEAIGPAKQPAYTPYTIPPATVTLPPATDVVPCIDRRGIRDYPCVGSVAGS
jgi:hypothetical protein